MRLTARALPRLLRTAVVAAAAILVSAPAMAAFHALEEIPVESPVYRDLDALVASYGFVRGYHSTKPWDRADLGRFLDALGAAHPSAIGDPAFLRLRRELEPGDALGGWEPGLQLEDERSAIEISPYGRADYREDRARDVLVRDLRAGAQLSLAWGEQVLVFSDVFAGTTSRIPHGNPVESRRFGLVEDVQLNSYFDRAYLTWRTGGFRLHAGHSWLRWGPGFTGGVGLSDGAPAFDFAEARATFADQAQFAWFVGQLDPVADTWLAGHRLEWRAGPSLEVSAGELARFDGVSNAPLYAIAVVPYSLIEKRLITSSDLPSDSLPGRNKNNVMWTADAAWRSPRGYKLYAEVAVDDISFSSQKRPRAIAWQVGGLARRRFGGDAVSVRGEYSRVYQYTYSVFHRHDFAHAGMPTGYPLGPDADQVAGGIEWRHGPGWTVSLDGAFVRKGEGALGEFFVPGSASIPKLVLSGVLDQDARGSLSVDYAPAPGLQLGVTGGFARVKALAHVSGRDETGAFGALRAGLRW